MGGRRSPVVFLSIASQVVVLIFAVVTDWVDITINGIDLGRSQESEAWATLLFYIPALVIVQCMIFEVRGSVVLAIGFYGTWIGFLIGTWDESARSFVLGAMLVVILLFSVIAGLQAPRQIWTRGKLRLISDRQTDSDTFRE